VRRKERREEEVVSICEKSQQLKRPAPNPVRRKKEGHSTSKLHVFGREKKGGKKKRIGLPFLGTRGRGKGERGGLTLGHPIKEGTKSGQFFPGKKTKPLYRNRRRKKRMFGSPFKGKGRK